jgi:apoptosis-inducing factor 2
MEKKKIVVIGGGFTGALCAKFLQEDFDLTLIDTKEYFEFTPGILRTIVIPSHAEKVQVCHKTYLKKGKFIRSRVISIDKDHVAIKGKKIYFDYLVIALGSRYNPPIKEQDVIITTRAKTLVEQSHKLHDAESILIIGGGLVGVEMAAEIKTKYPEKELTIVHSKKSLIDRNKKKSIKYASEFLEKRGVKIIYNERVISKKGKTYFTDKGTEVKAQTSFVCTGITPNSKPLKKNFGKLLDEKGQLQVNNFLQVNQHENIFAGGDITNIQEEKTAQSSEKHGRLIVKNIRALENRVPLIEYKSKRRPMVISLGKYNGIFELGKYVFTGIIPAFIKHYVEWRTVRRYK